MKTETTVPFTAPWRHPIVLAAFLAVGACAGEPADRADLILTNGKVVTVDEAMPEAQAVAIKDGRILAVGSSADIQAYGGPATRVVDLDGRLAVPGFIEGHGHFMDLGQTQMILDLSTAADWDDIVAMVGEAAGDAQPGQWIQGHGWHQEKWSRVPEPNVDGVPLHEGLSAASPENPVILSHASGHAAFANAKAMELAGITATTADPAGGTVVKDAAGNPTGLLRENADALVYSVMQREMDARSDESKWEEFQQQVRLAGANALENGVTSFQDAGESFATIDGLRRLAEAGQLPLRLYVMVRFETNDVMREKLPAYRMIGYGNDFLTVRSIKRQIDGALGSHGAWLQEPYADLATSTGLEVEEPADIEETASIAAELGYQLNTHAIGDRANREVLDMYDRTFQAQPGADRRWRIEHAQHLNPSDIPRFAELGVIAAMQGIHCTSDAPWVLKRLGAERAESGAYMWRSLIDSGAVIGNGTDVPVERISPIASFAASVVRQDLEGNDFYPAQKMTRMEALRSYTINNAYAAFEEDLKGSITPGKLADIAILDRDLMTIPDEELPMTKVDMTILGGQVAFERAR
ncbi:MAG TPA: amidohydrolase [Longimicrobiales bacterium]|nr:amidohydrolase [Longimicrobiales bacterium]